jgi:prepilin-type N-terminal cleavage/methylation domain-containing protein
MKANKAESLRGFTLVELLVVIAIIGVLVALLLPAVQAAREASRRSQCLSNLRQIAIGCHNFQTAKGSFPSAGGVVEQFFNPDELSKPKYGYEGASWMYQILPYIEQQSLYNLRRGDGAANAGFVKTGLAEKTVSLYNCPSRDPNARYVVHGVNIYALGDYAGVMANWNDPGWAGFAWQTSRPPNEGEEEFVWTGILVKGGQVNKSAGPQIWKFQKVDFKSIEDGSSNTILLAEKAVRADAWTVTNINPFPYWEIYGYYTGADWPVMRLFGAIRPQGPNPSPEIPILGDSDRRTLGYEHGFGSAHPTVICTVWGDGATRAISMSADLYILDQLGKRSDGSTRSYNDL